MHIIYKITYLKHLRNNTPPFYYIGSKYNYTGKYYGSPSSKQKDWFTEGLSVSDWWKKEVRNNPGEFSFEVMEVLPDNITPQVLVEEEKTTHLKYDVSKSELFFNKSIATSGWVSAPRTEKTKKSISEITKKYWKKESEEIKLRKQKLVEYNKNNSSEKLKKTKMNNPEKFTMTEEKKQKLSIKNKNNWLNGVYDFRKKRKERRISVDGQMYENAIEVGKQLNMHPVNVRRKCRDEKYINWFYLE